MTPAIKALITNLVTQRNGSMDASEVPGSLKGVYTRMIKAGLAELKDGRYIATVAGRSVVGS